MRRSSDIASCRRCIASANSSINDLDSQTIGPPSDPRPPIDHPNHRGPEYYNVSRGKGIPTFIPKANEFAEQTARRIGGVAMSMTTEILFDMPGTAHVLGGCTMGEAPESGVVDDKCRVFGYRNMYICDGSVLSANLGVNPSLTITAVAERAMSFVDETRR